MLVVKVGKERSIQIKEKKNAVDTLFVSASVRKRLVFMVEDEEGFEYPQTDENAWCYQCG